MTTSKTTAKLISADKTEINAPNESDISSALQLLSTSSDNNVLTIDHGDEMTYLRATGDPYNGFVLEYQEETPKEHHRSVDDKIGFNLTLQIFKEYAEQTPKWKETVAWKKNISTKTRFSIKPEILVILLLIIILALFILSISSNPFSGS